MINEAQASLVESSQKIDLIRAALERLEAGAERASLTSQTQRSGGGASSEPQSPTSVASVTSSNSLSSSSAVTIPKPAAVTGQLQVRLMGCQSLLSDVPGKLLLLLLLSSVSNRLLIMNDDDDECVDKRLILCFDLASRSTTAGPTPSLVEGLAFVAILRNQRRPLNRNLRDTQTRQHCRRSNRRQTLFSAGAFHSQFK